MSDALVLKDTETVLPIFSVDDQSDKRAYVHFIGAFVVDVSELQAVSDKIRAAYVRHHNLEEEIGKRDGNYKNVPDIFQFIRDACGLREFPRCGWLLLEDRYLQLSIE